MALDTTKTINLTGESKVGNTSVVYFNASVSTGESNTNINQNITDQDLYNANRKQCRADAAEFQELVYETEDALALEGEQTK